MKLKILLGTVFPLLFGALIYIIFRPTTIRFVTWLAFYTSKSPILALKKCFSSILVPNWFIYNLPDTLWFFGLTNLFSVLWSNIQCNKAVFWKLSPLFIALIHEFSQLTPFVSGTFDILDVFFYLIGFSLSIIINLNK